MGVIYFYNNLKRVRWHNVPLKGSTIQPFTDAWFRRKSTSQYLVL